MTAPVHNPDQATALYLLCRHRCGWWLPCPTLDREPDAQTFRAEHEARCPSRPPRTIGDLPW